jgi:hypothetical protein
VKELAPKHDAKDLIDQIKDSIMNPDGDDKSDGVDFEPF